MDPEATLTQAAEALEARRGEDCEEHLSNYHDWRRRGGFEPADGDARALELYEALEAHLDADMLAREDEAWERRYDESRGN